MRMDGSALTHHQGARQAAVRRSALALMTCAEPRLRFGSDLAISSRFRDCPGSADCVEKLWTAQSRSTHECLQRVESRLSAAAPTACPDGLCGRQIEAVRQ